MPVDPDNIDYCQFCQSAMDVSEFAPFSNVECPTCGQQSRVKLKFGPFVLTRRYAIGGMSMVFSAHDTTLDREVAVKILSEEFSQDETRINAFEEEAKITASFSHPNVVRVLRTGKAFGRFYIAMELVTGGHFEHHIRERGKIPEIELLPLAIEVAHGLKAAQTAGLIHRDVKPGNILLGEDGHAKLVDFGLALVTQEGKATASELWATPFYVPPEQVEGKEEDFRSDIYALGATLYHALAGVPPCNEQSMSTNLLLQAKQQIVPLHKVAPEISERTCQIVERAMAYHPDNRFHSYDELIRALTSALKHARNEPARREILNHRARKSRIRNILICGIVAATGLIVFFALKQASIPDPIAKPPSNQNNNGNTTNPLTSADEIAKNYRKARDLMKSRSYEEAIQQLSALFRNAAVQEPSRTWAGIEAITCHYLNGDSRGGQRLAEEVINHIAQHKDTAATGSEIPAVLKKLQQLPTIKSNTINDTGARQLIALMLAGLKNWEQGMLDPAVDCFRTVAATRLSADDQWAAIYQQLASDYIADHQILNGPLFRNHPGSKRDCEEAIQELNEELVRLKTRGRSRYNVRAWQLDLARYAKAFE